MEKLIITVQNSFLPEKRYVLDTLLWQFLGIPFSLVPSNKVSGHYRIELPGKKEVFLADCFFSNFSERDGYLSVDSMPTTPIIMTNEFCKESNLPVLFGSDEIRMEEKKKTTRITCGADIFASAFFFLSRWEETVLKDRDKHSRFPCVQSYIQRHGLEGRPVVNEYVEFLWELLVKMQYPGQRIHLQYKVLPTHDVDYFRRFDSLGKIAKTITGDIALRKNSKMVARNIKTAIQVTRDETLDPFDTFDYLMTESEKQGLKSEFFFIPSLNREFDAQYDIRNEAVERTIKNIVEKGHRVSMHGSYNVFNNPAMFKTELERLSSIAGKIDSNRMHYLRFDLPRTWQMLFEFGFAHSHNMGFTNKAGFRASCCLPFPVFNVHTRRTLSLVEHPLIMMESALVKDQPKPDTFFEQAIALANTVKKYRGEYVFLWHNSNLNLPEWEPFGNRYGEFLRAIV